MSELHTVDPPEGEDERVDALRQALRRNGIGGAAPFTIEGEIEQMGNIASGTLRRGGPLKAMGWIAVLLLLGAVAISVVVTVGDILN